MTDGARLQVSADPRVVTLENDRLRVRLNADHGAEIVECRSLAHDLDVVLRFPAQPGGARHAVPDPDLAFIDGYAGGWQDVFPNGGAPSTYAGVRFGQHDEAWRCHWSVEVLDDGPEEVAVVCATETTLLPFRLERELRLPAGAARLEIRESAHSLGREVQAAMWGQHLAYGPPFLVPGTRLTLPAGVPVRPHATAPSSPQRRFAPRPGRWPALTGPDGTPVDLTRAPERGEASDIAYVGPLPDPGWYELARPDGITVRVQWDATTLPYCWLWYEPAATAGYPWYGRLMAFGVEPFSSWPTDGLATAVANGSALTFAPGATHSYRMAVEVRG